MLTVLKSGRVDVRATPGTVKSCVFVCWLVGASRQTTAKLRCVSITVDEIGCSGVKKSLSQIADIRTSVLRRPRLTPKARLNVGTFFSRTSLNPRNYGTPEITKKETNEAEELH